MRTELSGFKRMLLSEKSIVIFFFLIIGCIKLVSSLFDAGESNLVKILRLLGLSFNFTISFYAFKNRGFAIWIISIIIFLSGISAFISSIFLFIKGHGEITLQIFLLLTGGFFSYGGIKIVLLYLKEHTTEGEY